MASTRDRRPDGRDGDGPVDLSAVLADEAWVEQLRAGQVPVTDDPATAELAGMFAALRADVDAAPLPAWDLDEAVAAVRAGRGGQRRRRMLSVVAGAASVALVAGGIGVLVAGNNAVPPRGGQTVEQDTINVSVVRAELQRAADHIDRGEVGVGLEILDAARRSMSGLPRDAEFSELDTLRADLWARATGRQAVEAPGVEDAGGQWAPAPQERHEVPPAEEHPLWPLPDVPGVDDLPLSLLEMLELPLGEDGSGPADGGSETGDASSSTPPSSTSTTPRPSTSPDSSTKTTSPSPTSTTRSNRSTTPSDDSDED